MQFTEKMMLFVLTQNIKNVVSCKLNGNATLI